MRRLLWLLLLVSLPASAQVDIRGSTIITGAGGGGGCAPFCALTNVANVFTHTNTFPALTVTGGINGLPVYENTGLFNVGLGVDSTPTSATGNQNLGIGDGTLAVLTSGYDNVSLGVAANGSVTTGFENTAFGTFALQDNVSGGENDAMGSLALANATGSFNTAFGESAMNDLIVGDNNVAVGYNAGCGTSCASSSGPINQVANSIFVGFQAAPSANNVTNQILIGYNIQSAASNQMILGDPAITASTIYGIPTFPALGGAGAGCIGIDNTGLTSTVSCGSGGGGSTITVNGSALISSATVNFVNDSNVLITNPSAGNIHIAVATFPYSGLTGSVPTWNQSTTGNAATATSATSATTATTAAALSGTPTLCSSGSSPTGILSNGNATGCQAVGGGGGGGPTLQHNTVANTSQTLLNNTDTTSIAWTNPSGGVVSAALIAPGVNTLVGFNGSSTYTGFTLGTGLAFSGSTLVNTGITGSLTTNCIPKATSSTVLGCSSITDTGSQVSIAEPLAVTGTTPGDTEWAAGTGTLTTQVANSVGLIGPATGGTSYDMQFANTAAANGGVWLFGAPTTLNGHNVIQGKQVPFEYAIQSGVYNFGASSIFAVIASDVPLNNGHFTELIVNTVGAGGGCTSPPQFLAFDGNTNSAPATASTSQTFQNGSQVKLPLTLPFSAGDNIGIIVSTAGSGCPAPTAFSVVAHVSIP